MIAPLVELDLFVKLANLAVDACTVEARALELFEFLFEFAFAPAHDRRKNHHALAFGQMRHLRDDLIGGLARNLPPALRAMRQADA